MLPQQLRRAVEAAHQTAQERQKMGGGNPESGLSAEEHSRLAELQKQRQHLEMRQLQVGLHARNFSNFELRRNIDSMHPDTFEFKGT